MSCTKRKWKIYRGAKNVSERIPPEGGSYLWNIWVVDENNKAIAQIHSNNDDVLKANAHLIAAAPDLYEASKGALADLDSIDELCRVAGVHPYARMREDLEKALAKAEG